MTLQCCKVGVHGQQPPVIEWERHIRDQAQAGPRGTRTLHQGEAQMPQSHSCYTCDRSRSGDGRREDSTSFRQVPHNQKRHPEWAAAATTALSGSSLKDGDSKSCQWAEHQTMHLLCALLGRRRGQMCRHSLTLGLWPAVPLDGQGLERSRTVTRKSPWGTRL